MTKDQQRIQSFVSREIAPWRVRAVQGPWLTEHTAARFRASVEREAISYVEERALTGAVESVLGADDPAVPFVVLGLKEVLDAETPRAVRLAHEHPEVALVAACLALLFVWKFLPEV